MNWRLAIAFALTACRTTSAIESLDAAMPKLLAGANVPGAAVAIVDGDHVAVRSYGVADVESKTPVDNSTVFEAASLGKVVFAYAVMRLADRGLIDLDRPPQTYLPAPYIADSRIDRLTGRMVLMHRSGLPNWRAKDKDLQFIADPGTRWGYSGEGFVLLQKTIEALSHEPIESTMRREVLDPIGMTQTTYIWLPSYNARKAWGHTSEGKRWRRRKPEGASVAATLQTTASDLGKFVAALARNGSSEMFRAQSDVPETCAFCANRAADAKTSADIHWGLGVALLQRGDATYFWHWGDNGDFHAYIFGNRSSRRAVVVLTNGANGLKIAGDIARIAMDDPAAVQPLAWLGYVKSAAELNAP